jgi:hypothetical protein
MIDNIVQHLPNDITQVIVTRRDGSRHHVLMDTPSFFRLRQPHLHLLPIRSGDNSTFYAACYIGGKRRLLHRVLFGYQITDNDHVDHIDGNGLQNCFSNLRLTDQSGNMRNTRRNRHKYPKPEIGFCLYHRTLSASAQADIAALKVA